MKLAQLLDQHARFNDGLPESFGDGYLCAQNRVYGRIRKEAKALGFQFSLKQNDAYRALPLSQLEEILKSKTIPFIDNVSVLKDLEKRIPKQTVWNDISDNLKGNSVFHEACHAFARGSSSGLAKSFEPTLSSQQARVLAMLLEESFANSCELLSIMDAEDQAHRIFIELNSYIFELDARVHLNNAAKDIGVAELGRFMMLAYLHANFLTDIENFDRLIKLAGIGKIEAKTVKNLRQLSKLAFQLNPRFREVTTRFYLLLSGMNPDQPGFLDFDFIDAIERSRVAKDFLRKAWA